MEIVSVDISKKKIINIAIKVLKNGGVVIYPTETCYGIGVDATNAKAVEKLIKYKGDRRGKPISVAVSDITMVKKYADLSPAAENLFNNFLPGPITIVAQGKHKVDSNLESDTGTLGIRYPDYGLILKIIKKFGKPITSTSANVSNGKTPYDVQADILDRISLAKKELIDLIIDAGVLPHRAPSTIVDTTLNEPKILRQGEFIFDILNTKTYVSNSVEETIKIGELLIKNYELRITNKKPNCLIIALQGDLGAGKTQFVKGIARGLGIKNNIKSPTFILCSEYLAPSVIPAQARTQRTRSLDSRFRGNDSTRRILFHIDTWRMESEKELLDIGFEKMISSGNVIAIEWGEKVFGILKKIEKRKDVKVIWVKIETIGENKRKILC